MSSSKAPFCKLTHCLSVQIIGYSGRIWSHSDPLNIGGYIMQSTLILIAPARFTTSIYLILPRIIRALNGESLSILPIRSVKRFFIICDIISLVLQAGGGGIEGNGNGDLGRRLIVGGLFVQIFMFGFFFVISIPFNRRISEQPTALALSSTIKWKRHFFILYITSILILVRTIFRIVEYLQGDDGFLISHEIFIYIFDAILMFLVMLIFAVWYIGDLRQKRVRMHTPVYIKSLKQLSLTSVAD